MEKERDDIDIESSRFSTRPGIVRFTGAAEGLTWMSGVIVADVRKGFAEVG